MCFFSLPLSQHPRRLLHLRLWPVVVCRHLLLLHRPHPPVQVSLLRHRRLPLAGLLRLPLLRLQEVAEEAEEAEAVEEAASVEVAWQLPWQEPNSEKPPR